MAVMCGCGCWAVFTAAAMFCSCGAAASCSQVGRHIAASALLRFSAQHQQLERMSVLCHYCERSMQHQRVFSRLFESHTMNIKEQSGKQRI